MANPYSVLNVPENATEDEIKKAYRTLSRKYHPDANINNPNKEAAEEKFKEIQQAYQQIMDMRQKGYTSYSDYTGQYNNSSNTGYSGSQYGGFNYSDFEDFIRNGSFGGFQSRDSFGNDEDSIHLQAAANYINNRSYKEAINVLDGINNRNAKWYYYYAMASAGMGNNVTALNYAKTAVQMDPSNMQYQSLYSRLSSGGTWYKDMQSPYTGSILGTDNLCLKLCFWNLVCNLCCGGSGLCFGGYRPMM